MGRTARSTDYRAICSICAVVVMLTALESNAADELLRDPRAEPDWSTTAAGEERFGHILPKIDRGWGEPPNFRSGGPDFLRTQNFVQSTVAPGQDNGGTDHVLPDGLLYRSYIAAPNEPRFATVLLYDVSAKNWRWDSILGGRVGLFRRDQPEWLDVDACQIDLEGAAIPRLNPEMEMDVESVDFRFGLLWTARRDNLAFKAGYYHFSSHVGDEYLVTNPTYQRVNFVRESLVLGTSLQATPEFRTYGEIAWAPSVRGGAKPWQFQMGGEYSAIAARPHRGAPFSAVNLNLREEVRYASGLTAMTGWQWKGPESGRSMRFGLQYYNGYSNQYEFFRRYDNQLGMGIWFDY